MDRLLKIVFHRQRTLFLFWMMVSSLVSCFAAGNTIAGAVRNDSTGKSADGDEVILLRLMDGMQQEARTRTDAQGATLIEALKEELFQLEADRIHGSISREEYVTTKQALDETVRRAVAKVAQK